MSSASVQGLDGALTETRSLIGGPISDLRQEVAQAKAVPRESIQLLGADGVELKDDDTVPDESVTLLVSWYRHGLVGEWRDMHGTRVGPIHLEPGNTPHSISALITWPEQADFPLTRSWILNLGHYGTGAHHWLWNPSRRPYPQEAQIGAWCGVQAQRPLPAEPGKQTIMVTTFDGASLKVYFDGALHDEVSAQFRFSRASLDCQVAIAPRPCGNESAFPGTVHEVVIWNRALSEDEVIMLVERSA